MTAGTSIFALKTVFYLPMVRRPFLGSEKTQRKNP